MQDTKTAQRQLVSLITEHLSDSIPVTRILTYKPDKSGSVTGRFESMGRVFNFAFNGTAAKYKPAMNADSALFSEYFLQRFDAAPATPRGTRALPRCTAKSYSCKGNVGVRCLPLTQNCKMGTSEFGNERLGKIKNLAKMLATNGEDGSKIEATRAKIVEQRMALAAENRAKREPKKIEKATQKGGALALRGGSLTKTGGTPSSQSSTKQQEPDSEPVNPIFAKYQGDDSDANFNAFMKEAGRKNKIDPKDAADSLFRDELRVSPSADPTEILKTVKDNILESAKQSVKQLERNLEKKKRGEELDEDDDGSVEELQDILAEYRETLQDLQSNPKQLEKEAKRKIDAAKRNSVSTAKNFSKVPIVKAAVAAGIPMSKVVKAYYGSSSGLGDGISKIESEIKLNLSSSGINNEFFKFSGKPSKTDLKQAYRRASEKYHPDKGGSTEAMQKVNALYERLMNKYNFDSFRVHGKRFDSTI